MRSPLFPPSKVPVTAVEPATVKDRNAWSGPVVTIHPDAVGLVGKLYDHQVLVTRGKGTVPAGSLVLGDADAAAAAAALGDYLGVPLKPGLGYMLVRQVRKHRVESIDPSETGGQVKLTPAADGAVEKLPDRSARPSVSDAAQYLSFFETFGTHFVTAVHYGEVIFQVFAYEEQL
ncbi:MAC/perforin domain-containing protein, partial [Kitasatospora sp. NPDC093558]|uniref:MAC/perforin domain-containing protein n=1 Tax=Kitasatospora sp. NPDC093558 TaxID=3155201 RepID=UPI003444AFA3